VLVISEYFQIYCRLAQLSLVGILEQDKTRHCCGKARVTYRKADIDRQGRLSQSLTLNSTADIFNIVNLCKIPQSFLIDFASTNGLLNEKNLVVMWCDAMLHLPEFKRGTYI